jgi:hypothetical protein
MLKKIFVFVSLAATFVLTSCIGPQMVGRNTINTVYWPELMLDRTEYVVLERVTATATVTYDATFRRKPKIIGDNDEFVITVKPYGAVITDGVCKFGYLQADIGVTTEVKRGLFKKQGVVSYVPSDPEIVARRLAVYRLINEAKAIGADALIEPIISSDVASTRRKINVIKTTVSAKAVAIKTDEEK